MSSAKIIADARQGDFRVTTMEVEFHRFVLAEFNTHRMFSRNSASSRAIPADKQIERVLNNPAYPISWPQEQKGMQGGAEIDADPLLDVWQVARDDAAYAADQLRILGLHKSVTNRLLEPFMWHKVIVTGMDEAYENFFAQRCSPLAQPEIRDVAEKMQALYKTSTPTTLAPGQWHLPYIDKSDWLDAIDHLPKIDNQIWSTVQEKLIKVSAARCARVSYLTHDGKRDQQADLDLYERLVSAEPPHWSPLEHPCVPDYRNKNVRYGDGLQTKILAKPRPVVGNLVGFLSLRSQIELGIREQ